MAGSRTFRGGAWRVLAFAMVCELGLAYGVTAVMTRIFSGFLR